MKVLVFRVKKEKDNYRNNPKKVSYKTIKLFNPITDNFFQNDYYYFNMNLEKGLWFHNYCQQMNDIEILKAFKKAKNLFLMIELYISINKDVYLQKQIDEYNKESTQMFKKITKNKCFIRNRTTNSLVLQ